jgi:tetratricopeptide (TPR) repeat protein
MEGAVLRVGPSTVRLRPIGEEEPVTLRPGASLVGVAPVPGEIAQVEVERRWRYRGHAYASGRLLGARLDVAALGLEPLAVVERGLWSRSTAEAAGVPVSAAVRFLVPRGPLPDCEMEQVIPGDGPDGNADADPAIAAIDYAEAGRVSEALAVLGRAVALDLRYLDGHAHLGNVVLRRGRRPETVAAAIRHFAVGVAIGRSFLPTGFAGCLRYAMLDNRPFLRCLIGLALCQGASGDHAAAAETARALLRYDPEDRLGAESLLADLARGDTSSWLAD